MKNPKMVKIFSIVLMTIIASQLIAQEVSILSKLEKSNNGHNTGTVWLGELVAPDSVFQFGMAFASFAPNSRLDWHFHPGGQVLIITEGTGFYQEKGQAKRTVNKGEVIKCQPNVVHWHGATPTTSFSYIASSPSQKGKTQWLQPLTEEEYKN